MSTPPPDVSTTNNQRQGLSPRRWETLLLVGIGTLLAALLLGRALGNATIERMEHAWLDPWVLAADIDERHMGDVAVVVIDDETLETLGERWPLRRRTWAKVLTALSAYKPAAIAVDAWFESPEPSDATALALDTADKLRLTGLGDDGIGAKLMKQLEKTADKLDGDRRLGVALANAGNVILGTACIPSTFGDKTEAPVPESLLMADEATGTLATECHALSSNTDALVMAARGQASLAVFADPDGRVRRYPYAVRVGQHKAASLALAAIAVGRPKLRQSFRLPPMALDGGTPYQRPISTRKFTVLRVVDLLAAEGKTKAIAEALEGRLVFVGVSARGTEDYVATPLAATGLPGVFLHANAALDLLQGRHLIANGAPATWGGLLAFILFIVLVTVGQRLTGSARLAVAAAVASIGWVVLGIVTARAGWLLPVVPVISAVALWFITKLGFHWFNVEVARRAAQSARERMETELNVARDIQLAMMPPELPAGPGVSLAAAMEPAREVGGDLYDAFFVDDGLLYLCMGDVSGKGVPASLFMAQAKTLLKAWASRTSDTGEIIENVNDVLSLDNETAMFVTLFIAMFDPKTGLLRYTNAGHNPPIIIRAAGGIEEMKKRHGPVVGAMEELPYGSSETNLQPGDVLVTFTDGVTEAMNPVRELYSDARYQELLTQMPNATAQEVLDATYKSVRAFAAGAEQNDDITVLILRHDPEVS